MAPQNRRRHARWLGRGLAGHVHSSNGRALPSLTVENVSMGGLFVRSATTLPIGTPVVIELVRRNLRKMIRLEGKVVSHSGSPTALDRPGRVPGMGVRFDPYGGEIEWRLRELLELLAAEAQISPAPKVAPPVVPLVAPSAPTDELEYAPVFAPEHEGAALIVAVPDETLDASVNTLKAELEIARLDVEQERRVNASLRAAIEGLRAEIMRVEQENDELAARLRRLEE